MTLRVSIFIDYQNVYHGARRAFHQDDAPNSYGQIRPLALGWFLCSKLVPPSGSDERRLQQVRVYRGMPRLGTPAYDATQRQHAAWTREGVLVVTRPMRQRPHGMIEKGIDVEMALDFFAGALDGDFDIGIICSADTDLLPALEKVWDPNRQLGVIVESANWWNPPHATDHLGSGLDIQMHRLNRADYESVRDKRNYARRRRGRKG